MLKRATVVQPVPGRQVDLVIDALLRFCHERTEVAPTHVGCDHDPTLAVLPADLCGSGGELDVGDFAERQVACATLALRFTWEHQRQAFQRCRVLPKALGQPHDQLEPAVTVEDQACSSPAYRCRDQVLDGLHIEAITGQRRAVWDDRQHRQAADLLDAHVCRTVDVLHHGLDGLRATQQFFQVITKHLDAKVCPDA